MKLIKLTDDHYVVVDDSEIKEGDWWINAHPRSYYIDRRAPIASSRFAVNSNAVFSDPKKITHSTKPIEQYYCAKDGTLPYVYHEIKELSLQEAKAIAGEVDVNEKAEKYADYSNDYVPLSFGDKFNTITKRDYLAGYNQALEDNKEKKYTEEDIIQAFEWGFMEGTERGLIQDSVQEFKKSIQPPTEWEVEFDENGKLKLK